MKMNGKAAVIFIFMLLFAFSSLPSTISFPSRRSLQKNSVISDEKISRQHVFHEFQKKERMDIEIADYSGTGANNHHDPRSPPGIS